MTQAYVTRFAPSPTGFLHLGHAYSALFAERLAQESGGRFLLRIEDIDPVRCKPEFEAAILEDLAWLGLSWEPPVRRQSDHLDDYKKALDALEGMGLLYPCFCTRKDIQGSGQAPHGPDGPLYPGICKALGASERRQKLAAGLPFALRLDMERAARQAGELTWRDLGRGEQTARPEIFGDVVLARKDVPTSYHLAVTLDDHLQGVTLVTRGEDLFEASHVHRLLQTLLRLDVPCWRHHPLLKGPSGARLAKRDRAETLRALRESGLGVEELRHMIALQEIG
jgi:glutamyl-Q tRNA(Asp) synthetase